MNHSKLIIFISLLSVSAAAAPCFETLLRGLQQQEAAHRADLEELEEALRFEIRLYAELENIVSRLNAFAETLPENNQANGLQHAVINALAALINMPPPTILNQRTLLPLINVFKRDFMTKELDPKKLQALKKALNGLD